MPVPLRVLAAIPALLLAPCESITPPPPTEPTVTAPAETGDQRCARVAPHAYTLATERGYPFDCTPDFEPLTPRMVAAWDGTTPYVWTDRLPADTAVVWFMWHELGHAHGFPLEDDADRWAECNVWRDDPARPPTGDCTGFGL